MSNNQTQTVTLDKVTISFEEYARIEALLSPLPYKTVRPIFEIFERRLVEQAQAKLEDMNATKEAPEPEIIDQVVPIREGL